MSSTPSLLTLAIEVLFGSLVIPTLVLVVTWGLRPGPWPTRTKLAAWSCFWVGQLAVPLALVVALCFGIGRDGVTAGAWAAVLVYGVAMSSIAAGVTVLALRVFALGIAVLGPVDDVRLRQRCGRLVRWALFGAIAALVYCWLPNVLQVPGGRWAYPIFIAFAVLPVGFTSLAALAVVSLLRWRR